MQHPAQGNKASSWHDDATLVRQWIPSQDPKSDGAVWGGAEKFFVKSLKLDPREYACLVQVQVDAFAITNGSAITVEARVLTGSPDGVLDSKELTLTVETLPALDDIVLRFRLSSPAVVELSGRVKGITDGARLRHVQVLAVPPFVEVERSLFRHRGISFRSNYLKTLFIGTTNTCNANCHHCPTNKTMTSHLARGVMSDEVYQKLLDGLSEVSVAEACFGLFGEPFNDPDLERRIDQLAQCKPEMRIDIATNAGAVELKRIEAVLDRVRRVAIHVEAVNPDRYNKLMTPLRADNVLPRVDEIVSLAPKKVLITTPLHQANLVEARGIIERWGSRGAEVKFSQLQTRLTDKTTAKRVALAAVPGFWSAELLDILVVDWDGKVLLTCDDFLRRQPIGDLNAQTLAEIMEGPLRREAFDDLKNYRWSKLPSLNDAMIDAAAVVGDQALMASDQARSFYELSAKSFQVEAPAKLDGDKIRLAHFEHGTVTPQVYGPYLGLRSGRYSAAFKFLASRNVSASNMVAGGAVSEVVCEVTSGYGGHVYGVTRDMVTKSGELEVGVEFEHEAAHGTVEFRIYAKLGGDHMNIEFSGLTLTPF